MLEPSGTQSWEELAQKRLGDWDKMTIKQKFDVIQNFLHFPALTIMVFARRKLGYRTLNPLYLILTGFLLVFLQNVQTPYLSLALAYSYWPYPLTIFVVAMIAWAFIQRRMRWRDMVRGIHWHTYSRGISYFSFLPLREDIINRFVDPLICMFIGYLAMTLWSQALGVWIMLASLAFLLGELRYYDLSLGRTLDLLDGLEETRVQSELLMTGPHGGNKAPRKIEETAGIPTGIGDDLIIAVQRRRAEAASAQANTAQAAQ